MPEQVRLLEQIIAAVEQELNEIVEDYQQRISHLRRLMEELREE